MPDQALACCNRKQRHLASARYAPLAHPYALAGELRAKEPQAEIVGAAGPRSIMSGAAVSSGCLA